MRLDTRLKTSFAFAAVVALLLLVGIGTSNAATTLRISNVTTTGFTVSWGSVSRAQAYSVWVEPVSANSGKLSSSTTSYTFTGGTAATAYTVKLDVLVNGTWSTVASTSVTTASAVTTATATTSLSISNVTSSGFSVGWKAVTGASAYNVWVEPVSVSSGQLTSTSWAFAGGMPSTSYTVKLDVLVSGTWTTMASTTATTTAAPAPTSTSSTSWTLQDPQSPITYVTNLSGLGLNVNNQQGGSYSDYAIDGTGDSGVLLQGTTTGVNLSRIRLTRVAVTSAVSWAKHGMYIKARGNSFSDIYAEQGGYAASGISVRMGNNTFTRTVIKGFPLAVTYYEHDGNTGTVTFKDGDWTFTGDTAVWGDDSNEPPTPYIKQAFLFDNIAVHGPAGAKFLSFGSSYGGTGLAYQGAGVTIRNCTINGRPVTAADVSGVPSSLLTVQ